MVAECGDGGGAVGGVLGGAVLYISVDFGGRVGVGVRWMGFLGVVYRYFGPPVV